MDLEGWSARLKVFADATRVRLLALLEREELTVAELSSITRLAQPRVSTHLAKLKEAGLVRDRRAGVSAYYRFDEATLDPAQRALWHSAARRQRRPAAAPGRRARARSAGRRARPTRTGPIPSPATWSAITRRAAPGKRWRARRCRCCEPGDVLDIASGDGVLAELLAPHAHRYVCVDTSARVVAAAAERLRRFTQRRSARGRHACPALRRRQLRPGRADACAHLCRASPRRRWPRPRACCARGGRLLLSSLARHEHRAAVEAYGHVNLGFSRQGTAQVRREGRIRRAQLRDGHAREAPAAFRSHLADREEAVSSGASTMKQLPWLHPQRVAKPAGRAGRAHPHHRRRDGHDDPAPSTSRKPTIAATRFVDGFDATPRPRRPVRRTTSRATTTCCC